MDHLDHLGGSIDGHQDMAKGVLRATLQSTDNGSLHFITSTGMAHAGREQEYIESSLLGTDLLSSQLPANLLNDYINSVSSSTANSIGLQSALMEHHYRPFGNGEELHSLSGEAVKEVSGTKDIPGFSTLSSYDKMINIGQSTSPISSGLAQIAGTIDSYVHFPLHASSSSGEGFDVMANALASVTTHQQQQRGEQPQQEHHYNHPHSASSQLLLPHQGHMHHHQSIVELPNPQQMASLGHPDTPASSSMGTLLPSVDATLKAYSHSSGMLPIVSSAPGSTDMHNGSTMTITSMSLNESPKRFFSCANLPSLISHNQRTTYTVADSLVSSKNLTPGSMMETESRTHCEDMVECVASSIENSSCTQLGTINLPHKKRLAKKLGDIKESFCNDVSEMEQSLMLANIQLSHREIGSSTNNRNYGHSTALRSTNSVKSDACKNSVMQHSSSNSVRQPVASFTCQLCGKIVQDQLLFFNHLKEHYEPLAGGNASEANTADGTSVQTVALPSVDNDKGTADGKKTKPKLPRVKHTKKLKNDRKQTDEAEEEESSVPKSDSKVTLSTSIIASTNCAKTMETLLQTETLNDAMIVLECSDHGGEFSETEDMLENIRNVVEKVQETVDTDTNEEQCIGNGAAWFAAQGGNGDGAGPATATTQQPEKGASLTLSGESLDSHEIHIPSGSDNFLLLLSKAQFNDAELLQSDSADTAILKPLDASTCEQLAHTNSLNGSSKNATYESELQSTQEQNLPQMQPLHSTPFPLISSVGTLAESHTVSFQSTDSTLHPLNSMLLSSNTISKLSVASFAPSAHCGQIPDLRKARLLKSEQKSDGDEYDETELPEYDRLTDVEDVLAVEPLNGQSPEAREEQSVEDYQFSGEEGAQPGEETSENEEETCTNDKERVEDGDAGSKTKLDKYLCPIAECGRRFKSKTAFSYHQLQHTGERPYQCQTCQKCFFTCSALKVHERLHSGEKPYKCEECGHHFRQWGDLKYHKISKHSNEKSHKCEFCGKDFARRYSLVLHRRIHTNEKNFVCEYCNKAFRASAYLQAHRMIHTGEKPHQCSICDKKFRCHGDLNRHQKTHARLGKMADSASSKKVNEFNDDRSSLDLPGDGKLCTTMEEKGKVKRKITTGQKNNNSIVILGD